MPAEDNSAIVVDQVTKTYRTSALKSHRAVDNVSFKVSRGDIFGFLGPNGAGKTSLIKILVGILSPDRGECRILGLDTRTKDAKLKLGYLPERPYFHEFLTSIEFLRFHGRLLGLDEDRISQRIPVLLDRVGLARARNQRLRTFSKGMLQRIGLAQALLHDPDVLILDEPMSGLDPVGRREVRDLISEISLSGKTIFFSTHIIPDVEVICTTVAYIDKGVLRGLGNIEALIGKTVESMEVRFGLPYERDPHAVEILKAARRTMDGWVLEVDSGAERVEADVQAVLAAITGEKGVIKAVIPRKSTLEDVFFNDGGVQKK